MSTANPLKKQGIPGERRGRSAHLDREKILDAARQLAQTRGAVGVTMRGIARHLGVDPAALYWHFADKAALLDALAQDAAQAPLESPALAGLGDGPWQDRARSLCAAIADRLRGDPALHVTGSTEASLGPFFARAVGTAGRVLADAGLEGEDLVFAAHTLVQTVTSVLGAQTDQAAADIESVRRYMRGVADELPEVESKRWVEVARQAPGHSFDAYLDHAIDIVIAGIESRTRRTKP